MMINKKIKYLIPYVICIIILTYILKPSILFKPNGQLRNYGFGYDTDGYKKTLFTMPIIIIFSIILITYLYRKLKL